MGKTSSSTIKMLHSLWVQSKSLRYVYSFLNENIGEHYFDKECYYMEVQIQLSEIVDLRYWLNKIKDFEKKLEISKSEIDDFKTKIRAKLHELMENVEFLKQNINV